jgi:hypothetical protein
MSNHIHRRTALVGLTSALVVGCGGGDDTLPPQPGVGPLFFAPGDLLPGSVAVTWSNVATEILYADALTRPMGLWPIEQARVLEAAFFAAFAAHAEIVGSLRPSGPYSTWLINPEAAVGTAVHDVLYELVPAQRASIDRALEVALAGVPGGSAKVRGRQAGQAAARRRLDYLATDGLNLADVAYPSREGIGEYQPTTAGEFSRFADVSSVTTGYASADQFRPPPPDDPLGERFAADLAEVRALGGLMGSARTPEQSAIAQFWAEPVPLAWQRLASSFWERALREAGRDSCQVLLQMFSGLQARMFGGYVAALDAAYFYRFWRPVTAIRSGLLSEDPSADRTWEPFLPGTPPWPEYVSGDAAASVLAASMVPFLEFDSPLRNFDCTSASLPGVRRSFATLNDAVMEIAASRIYGGHQFRNGVVKGMELGLRMASSPPPG